MLPNGALKRSKWHFLGSFWPKSVQKCQNEKTAATPVTVATHRKTERNSYLELGPIAKKGHFWPKYAILVSWGLRLATYCKSDSGIWKFRIFHYNKVVLVFGFLAKIQKRHFLPEKMLFFTFRWVFPFSMPFLSSQTSLFAPNFQNQVRKPDFEVCIPLRLNTLQKLGKITKQCYQTLFLGLMTFTTQNKCKLHSDQVSRHSVSKKCDFDPFFDFSWSHPEMGIFFWKNQKVAFLSQKTGSDGFPVANLT